MPVSDERQEDLASIREVLRDACADLGGRRLCRAMLDGAPASPAVWRTVGVELGTATVGLPEDRGGLGSLPEVAAVAEELGRALLPVPFTSTTVLVGQLLRDLSDEQAGPLADVLIGGGEAGAALFGPAWTWSPVTAPFRAVRTEEGWQVDGGSAEVLSGPDPVFFLTAARAGDEVGLFVVDSGADGCDWTQLEALDPSRPQGALALSAAPAHRLSPHGDCAAHVARAVAWATVSLAAEQLGAMESCLELTLEQVRTRHQFGRPIGGFQSIKHLCADLFVQVELARSAIARALDTEDDPAGLLDAASVAKIWCSDAFRVVAKEAIQLHGGIGFTWEHDAQLYYRRAHTDAAVLGQPRSHRRALAALHAW